MNPFPAIKEHVLLPWATEIAAVDTILRTRLTSDVLTRIVDAVPAEWLQRFDGPSRSGYLEFFSKRLKHGGFVEEAIRAHARLV